jgi:hypothetical protein
MVLKKKHAPDGAAAGTTVVGASVGERAGVSVGAGVNGGVGAGVGEGVGEGVTTQTHAQRGTARLTDVSTQARTHFMGVPPSYPRVHRMCLGEPLEDHLTEA